MTAATGRDPSHSAPGRVGPLLGWLVAVAGLVTAGLLSWRDEIKAGSAVAIAVGSVLVALTLAAILELRARDRLRMMWLDRLHQLTDDLARAAGSEDPTRQVDEAADRATAGVAAPQAMDQERLAFLRSVADQCEQARQRIELDRAREQARSDLELLARAAPRLAASLDVARVTETIKALVVPQLAQACELRVIPVPGGPLLEQEPLPPPEGDHLEVIELRAHARAVGQMELSRSDRPLTDEERTTAELLAEPAARALAHALRFSEELHASSTLQESLLPVAILPIEHLEVATRYLAATEGQAVGGDFYDVLRTPSGSAVLLVGDVQGKGIEAAALTSTARHTLRTAALEGGSPAEMLRRVNDVLLYADAERVVATGVPAVRFVTVSVVALTPSGEGFRGIVASGGHPPPLVIRPNGRVEQVLAEGPILGVFDDAGYEECHIDLGLSDVLVLYTDGVTERRSHPEVFDEVQLGRLVRNQLTARHSDAVAQLILDTVVELSPREVRDDVALVVARVTGPAS